MFNPLFPFLHCRGVCQCLKVLNALLLVNHVQSFGSFVDWRWVHLCLQRYWVHMLDRNGWFDERRAGPAYSSWALEQNSFEPPTSCYITLIVQWSYAFCGCYGLHVASGNSCFWYQWYGYRLFPLSWSDTFKIRRIDAAVFGGLLGFAQCGHSLYVQIITAGNLLKKRHSCLLFHGLIGCCKSHTEFQEDLSFPVLFLNWVNGGLFVNELACQFDQVPTPCDVRHWDRSCVVRIFWSSTVSWESFGHLAWNLAVRFERLYTCLWVNIYFIFEWYLSISPSETRLCSDKQKLKYYSIKS